MSTFSIASRLDRTRLAKIADGLAVAVAVSLPWSTSATSILLVLLLLALIPTLEWSDLRRELLTAAGGLPVLLFLLGAVGMVWAEVTWRARFGGLDSFVRLLVIPLLMAQFRRSDSAHQVLIGFLISCVALLIASFIVAIWPVLNYRGMASYGVPAKDYIMQSLEFTMCAAVLLDLAVAKARLRQWKTSAAFGLLGLAFLSNIVFIVTGRTALAIIPALILLYGIRHSGWKGAFGAAVVGIIAAAVVWTTSLYVRERVTGIYTEAVRYEQYNQLSSAGERLEFWKKSIRFIASAPLLGHGTGSIPDQFQRAAEGQTGLSAEHSANPHNQTFAVGIQLGLLGIVVLWAMWISHLLVFRGSGMLAWIGLVVVAANMVGSLFNSLVFDFAEGWLYVMGVGVVAGTLQRQFSAAQSHKEVAAASAAQGP